MIPMTAVGMVQDVYMGTGVENNNGGVVEMDKKIIEFELNGTKYYYVDYSKADNYYINEEGKFRAAFICGKCHGTGLVHWKRDNGICYDCGGSGKRRKTINVTKNISTAQNRLNKEVEKEEAKIKEIQDRQKVQLERNLTKTNETYSDKFYLIVDTDKHSSYKERDMLKSKGAKWNPTWMSWWVLDKSEIEGFDFIEVNTKDFINEYNVLDIYKVAEYKVNQLHKESV